MSAHSNCSAAPRATLRLCGADTVGTQKVLAGWAPDVKASTMQNNDIIQEIATLREQIEAADAAITRCQSRADQGRGTGATASAEEKELAELLETRDFMTVRLSRLESCKRTPDA